LGLEDYILDNARVHEKRVVVFTGPVFRADDRLYLNKYRLPQEFWKVVAILRTDGTLSATAYIQSQRDLIANIKEFSFGEYKTYQTPIKQVEQLTDLRFGALRNFDPLGQASAKGFGPAVLTIQGPEDLLL
jgi:endonuclease G